MTGLTKIIKRLENKHLHFNHADYNPSFSECYFSSLTWGFKFWNVDGL